jgi:predicted DsbA family dithiol-disulfide isomerase
MQMDIYYSYACRDSYLVYAWLKLVQKRGQALDINWRPFAIQMDDPNEYWDQSWKTANSELRGFIAAEAARKQGSESFQGFHDMLEQAVHEQFLELGDETTLIGAAQQAGLDVSRFQANWHDPKLVQIVQRSHAQAIERMNASGTPTLVFSNGHSFHLELNAIPLETDALKTLQAIEMLVVTHPYIRQLRQTNYNQ